MSVVIPCHNYARFLPAAVGSVIDQHGVDLQLIVVDDCSSDGSPEVAAVLAERDDRIEVRTHDRNRGHIETYNEGLAAAKGDYVVLLSADDMLTPGSLARATALLEAHPNVGFAYGRAVTFTTPEPPPARSTADGWRLWRGHDWVRARCRQGWNVIWCPEVVMRSSLQRELGGYRADLPRTADFEMWLRAASMADVGRIEGADQAYYRIHPHSMTRTIHSNRYFQLEAIAQAFATLPEAGLVPDSQRLNDQARRALAVRTLRSACRFYHLPGVPDSAALSAMAFAEAMTPDARRLLQWGSLQWRRWLLRRWPTRPRRGLELLSYLESGLHWKWLQWTE